MGKTSHKKELSKLLQRVAKLQAKTTKKSYTSRLEKMLADKTMLEEDLKRIIREGIQPVILPTRKPRIVAHTPSKRELVVMLNDTHFGLFVYPDEVNNVNSYGWKEACRRSALVLQQAMTFKPHNKNDITKVHLVLNGDLIAGCIHGIATKHQDVVVHQVNGMVHILAHFIQGLTTAYPFAQIEVTGVSGNHSDLPHKREGGRVVTEKYDNFENLGFYGLSWAFKDCKQISFNFPKTPYAILELAGGRALVTHGDVLFTKTLGSVGRSINIKALSEEIHKFSLGEIGRGKKPIKLVLIGHVHFYANFQTFHGVEVYIAPSMSGTDSYAHSLNINTNAVGQVVFESTNRFVIGDRRLIRVTDADHDAELDTLIPTFTRALKKE